MRIVYNGIDVPERMAKTYASNPAIHDFDIAEPYTLKLHRVTPDGETGPEAGLSGHDVIDEHEGYWSDRGFTIIKTHGLTFEQARKLAVLALQERDIVAREENDTVYVLVGETPIEIAEYEIYYQAGTYLEDNQDE